MLILREIKAVPLDDGGHGFRVVMDRCRAKTNDTIQVALATDDLLHYERFQATVLAATAEMYTDLRCEGRLAVHADQVWHCVVEGYLDPYLQPAKAAK